ncbi:MAG: hypothetical protein O7A09_13615 [Proteobacteria bacterium]|nr:hypothetical protein [Pseudomonadota bacterium]
MILPAWSRLPWGFMSEPQASHRPRHRRRWRSRAKSLVYILWPLVPLVAAVLLSVGVIRIIEAGPGQGAHVDLLDPPILEALDHFDLELYDEGVFWDETRLRRVAREQRNEIQLQNEDDLPAVGDLIPRSFLDDPAEFEVEVPESYQLSGRELPRSVPGP